MPSEKANAYHANLAAMHERAVSSANPTVADLRDLLEQFAEVAAPLAAGTTIQDIRADGVQARWVTPTTHGHRVLVYIHGGGYVTGSARSHTRIAGHLGARLHARSLLIHYRRPPESPHPGPVEDCLTVYRWLLDSGVPPDHIVFAGESAGGALALSSQFLARRRGVPLPAATAVMSPWADMEFSGGSVRLNKDKDIAASIEGNLLFARYFLGDGPDRRDSLVSPIHGDFTGFGPLMVQVGDVELVLDDARRVAAAAARDGVVTNLDVIADMQHMFQMWAGNMPEADAALDRIAAFLTEHSAVDADPLDVSVPG